MKDKLITYLGFATKSGNIVYGVDNIVANAGSVKLAIYDDALSENSISKLVNKTSSCNVKIFKSDEKLDVLLSKTNCKAIGVTSKDLATAIIKLNYLKEVRN